MDRDRRFAIYYQFENGRRATALVEREAYLIIRDLQKRLGMLHEQLKQIHADEQKAA